MDAVILTDQRDGQPMPSGAAGMADPVNVIFREFRQIVIEDMGDCRDVNSPCGHIGRNQYPDFAAAQSGQCPVACAL